MLRSRYLTKQQVTPDNIDQLARIFLLCFFGYVLFSSRRQLVHACYLPALRNIDEVKLYNWGGVGLAHMYKSMGSFSRRKGKTLGGPRRIWEVRKREATFSSFLCLSPAGRQ